MNIFLNMKITSNFKYKSLPNTWAEGVGKNKSTYLCFSVENPGNKCPALTRKNFIEVEIELDFPR